jgi:hypothetical protein
LELCATFILPPHLFMGGRVYASSWCFCGSSGEGNMNASRKVKRRGNIKRIVSRDYECM